MVGRARQNPRARDRRRAERHAVAALVCAALACFTASCETRVVRYNPPLAGLPGATSAAPVVRGPEAIAMTPTVEAQIAASRVQENPDGTKTLFSRNGLDLMYHIATTMRANDEKLFTEQVLSELTRDELLANGRDPSFAFRELQRRRRDIELMFKELPRGEFTPGVLQQVVGPRIMRVRVYGRSVEDVPVVGFDMRLEGANWKLRWIVENDGR